MAEVGGGLFEVNRQQTSVTGRAPRENREEQLRALQPLAAQQRGLAIQQRRLDLASDAQEEAQRQARIANIIKGVGAVAKIGFMAREAGVFDKLSGLLTPNTTPDEFLLGDVGTSTTGANTSAAPAGQSFVLGGPGEGVSEAAAAPSLEFAAPQGSAGGAGAGATTPAASSATALGPVGQSGAVTNQPIILGTTTAAAAPAATTAAAQPSLAFSAPQGSATVAGTGATTPAATSGATGGTTAVGSSSSSLVGAGGGALAGIGGGQLARNIEGTGPIGSPEQARADTAAGTGGISEIARLFGAEDEGFEQQFSRTGRGAAFGAGLGFITGGPVGAVAGAITGGISANTNAGGEAGESEQGSDINLCIIVTAAHGHDSDEVKVARRYRDEKMTDEAIRGYYMIAEPIAEKMNQDPEYKSIVKFALVDPLIAYGRFTLGMPMAAPPPTPEQVDMTHRFMALCHSLGSRCPGFVRKNGELV